MKNHEIFHILFSVVIPVFNSEKTVKKTVDRTIDYFEKRKYKYEILLINDGSSDESWDIVSNLAQLHEPVRSINLLNNYGQHNANLCGFRFSKGDYVITMDDDLQNPPEEIDKLIEAALEGYDLVIGRFKEKKHSFFRRIGSKFIGNVIRKTFKVKNDIVLTNFRIIHRDVVDRVIKYKTRQPYIPGLVLLLSSNQRNILVEHHARKEGKSNYSLSKIIRLISVILFNYSSIPLRYISIFGFFISVGSFFLALYYLLSAILTGSEVPGWSTLVVLLSFFNGILILFLSVVGEYVVRVVSEMGTDESYHVAEIVE